MTALSFTDINTTINHEPRVLDSTLARALGYPRPRKIRSLIQRHHSEIELLGTCPTVGRVVRGNPVEEYYLTEKQALYVCTKSRAPKAIDVTIQMVELFYLVRSGQQPAPEVSEYGWQVRDPHEHWSQARNALHYHGLQLKGFLGMIDAVPMHPHARQVLGEYGRLVMQSAQSGAGQVEGLRPIHMRNKSGLKLLGQP